MEVVAGGPGSGAVHYLAFGRRHLVQADDKEIRHVVGVYAEFAAFAVESYLAGQGIVAENGIALDLHAYGAVELEIVRQVMLPASGEASGDAEDRHGNQYGQAQSHFITTSLIITSLEPSELVISALRTPFPGMAHRPSGPVLIGRPLKVQEISSSTQL